MKILLTGAAGFIGMTTALRLLARDIEGVASKRERARRIADAFDIEAGNLFFEAALAQKDVRRRYPGASHVRLPVGGHYPYITRSETYTAILASILR